MPVSSGGYRPGGPKHDIPHRAWLRPDPSVSVDTRRTHCHRCLRPVKHLIHVKALRVNRNWNGWKERAGANSA